MEVGGGVGWWRKSPRRRFADELELFEFEIELMLIRTSV